MAANTNEIPNMVLIIRMLSPYVKVLVFEHPGQYTANRSQPNQPQIRSRSDASQRYKYWCMVWCC